MEKYSIDGMRYDGGGVRGLGPIWSNAYMCVYRRIKIKVTRNENILLLWLIKNLPINKLINTNGFFSSVLAFATHGILFKWFEKIKSPSCADLHSINQ